MNLEHEKNPIMNGQGGMLNILGDYCTDRNLKKNLYTIVWMLYSARYYVRGVLDKAEERLL